MLKVNFNKSGGVISKKSVKNRIFLAINIDISYINFKS